MDPQTFIRALDTKGVVLGAVERSHKDRVVWCAWLRQGATASDISVFTQMVRI